MGIRDFDLETNNVLKPGCKTAEEQAEKRDGVAWRDTFLKERLAKRERQFPILHKFIKYKSR